MALTTAATFLTYLARAKKRVDEQELSRAKLAQHLTLLRNVSPKKMQEQINELERRMSELINAEKQVITKQAHEDMFHRNLKDRMQQLEQKLEQYLQAREKRSQRVRELHEKIMSAHEAKQDIKQKLSQLERVHAELKISEPNNEALQRIQERIKQLNEKLVNEEN